MTLEPPGVCRAAVLYGVLRPLCGSGAWKTASLRSRSVVRVLGESASPKGLLAAPVDAPNGLAEAASSSVGEAPSFRDAPNGFTDEASSPLEEAPSCRFSSAADPAKRSCGDSGNAQGSPPESAAACGEATEDGELHGCSTWQPGDAAAAADAVAMLLRSGEGGGPAVTASC
jgi:hypothetical protein